MRAVLAVGLCVLAMAGLLAAGVPGAGAASKKTTAKASDGTMTWAFSNYVLVANPATLSVSEVHEAEEPATFDAGTGWTFTEGKGTFDPKTSAMMIAFPGSLEFGNTSRGNYAFQIANPTFTLDADGAGTLTADVSVRPPGATAYNPSSRIAVVDVTGATTKKTKKRVEVRAAPTAFADAFLGATTDLALHFRPTGSSNDPNKPPAPISVEFAYKVKK